jgi:hypothetical protein
MGQLCLIYTYGASIFRYLLLSVFWGVFGGLGGRGSKRGSGVGLGQGFWGLGISRMKGEENKILAATLAAKSSLFIDALLIMHWCILNAIPPNDFCLEIVTRCVISFMH